MSCIFSMGSVSFIRWFFYDREIVLVVCLQGRQSHPNSSSSPFWNSGIFRRTQYPGMAASDRHSARIRKRRGQKCFGTFWRNMMTTAMEQKYFDDLRTIDPNWFEKTMNLEKFPTVSLRSLKQRGWLLKCFHWDLVILSVCLPVCLSASMFASAHMECCQHADCC